MLVMEMDLEEVTHLKTTKKKICNFSKGVMVVIDIYLYIQGVWGKLRRHTSKNHNSLGKFSLHDLSSVRWTVCKPSVILSAMPLILAKVFFHQKRTRLSVLQQDVSPCSEVSLLLSVCFCMLFL